MIALTNIGFEFGGRFLYRNANWHIKPNERIGLIGMNGTGKSTLLRLINGEYQASEGSISKPRDLSIGFLNQDQLSFETEDTILNVAMSAFSRALELEKQLEEIIVLLETDHSDEVLNRLSAIQEEFDALDGYNIRYKCEKVLEGLGFTTAQLSQPYKKFSGGWRMRVMLAKLLLMKPNLLMLDEPTNHLDLPTIEWLENYLIDYDGTVIVVSHDREFLDRMVTKIVEVANQKINEYPGNYSFYLESKAERTDMQQRQYDNQQQFIKQQEQFINRFKAKASKATAAQSRVKLLEKIERIEAPEDDNAEISIDFRMSNVSGKVVTDIKEVSKSFPDVQILKEASGQIVRGDKIALIGANGKGKSTLLRLIANVEPYTGSIETGHNVNSSFYAQHQLESLNIENEILQELREHGGEITETQLRTLLGCFLFTGDEVFKKIKVLSGGEKARVALAKTLLEEANFLLLDEPTNHLDMRSINILIQALQQYKGTFIVVSHDRYFVSRIANKIWWLEEGELKEYPGTFDEYEYWRKKQAEQAVKNPSAKASAPKAPEVKKEKEVQPPVASNKLSNNQVKKIQDTFAAAEKKLNDTRLKLKQLEERFADNEMMTDSVKASELQQQYDHTKAEIVMLEQAYEKAFEEVLQLEQN